MTWSLEHHPLLTAIQRDCLEQLLAPYAEELADVPLYISLDKDVINATDSVVNWDSGHLNLKEVCTILHQFLHLARGRLEGMDIAGDWSPVRVRGLLRHFFHWTEHPSLAIDGKTALARNEQTNLTLLDQVTASLRENRTRSVA